MLQEYIKHGTFNKKNLQHSGMGVSSRRQTEKERDREETLASPGIRAIRLRNAGRHDAHSHTGCNVVRKRETFQYIIDC